MKAPLRDHVSQPCNKREATARGLCGTTSKAGLVSLYGDFGNFQHAEVNNTESDLRQDDRWEEKAARGGELSAGSMRVGSVQSSSLGLVWAGGGMIGREGVIWSEGR